MELDRKRDDGIEAVLLLEEGRYVLLEWTDGVRTRRAPPVDVTGGDRDLEVLPARWIVKVERGSVVFETAPLDTRSYATRTPKVHHVDLSSGAIESLDGTWHERKKHLRSRAAGAPE